MNQKKYLLVLIIVTLIFREGWAQNSQSLVNQSPIPIDLTAILAAGGSTETDISKDNKQWINYSFHKNANDPSASITVAIASGNLPPGIEIYIHAGDYIDQGNNPGHIGQSTGKIRVDHVPQVLIYDIGTCDTGKGKRHGHKITYSVEVTDYALVQSGDYTLFLQYTLKQ